MDHELRSVVRPNRNHFGKQFFGRQPASGRRELQLQIQEMTLLW